MKYLINIRGTNGSGKSSIISSMLDDPDVYLITKRYHGKSKKVCTVFPKYRCVVLGNYMAGTNGGMDNYLRGKFIDMSLKYCLEKFLDYDIYIESIMVSTSFLPWVDRFLSIESKYDRKCVVVNLLPSVETCIKRVYSRNGNKSFNEKGLISKYDKIKRESTKFSKYGVTSIIINNENKRVTPNMILKKLKEE